MRSGCSVSATGASESLASARGGADSAPSASCGEVSRASVGESSRFGSSCPAALSDAWTSASTSLIGAEGSNAFVKAGARLTSAHLERGPLRLSFNLARRPRRLRFERLGQRRSIIFGELCRHIAFGRRDGLDLLAQHAKAAIAQKFALTAEHRRGGQRDQPAPIKPRQRPLDCDAGKRFGARQPRG